MRRRFRRRPPGWFWLAALAAGAVAYRWWTAPHSESPLLTDRSAKAVAVIDGRTLGVVPSSSPSQSIVPVRLLGLARVADESAAQDWLRENVAGQTVRLEFDKRRRDSDGANLAYVYVGATFVNAELLRQGFAQYDAYPGDSARHARTLREAVGK